MFGITPSARLRPSPFYEATLANGASNGDQLRGHLTLEEAQAAFSGSRARRLIVTHRPVELGANGCELAWEGMVVEL